VTRAPGWCRALGSTRPKQRGREGGGVAAGADPGVFGPSSPRAPKSTHLISSNRDPGGGEVREWEVGWGEQEAPFQPGCPVWQTGRTVIYAWHVG
jgi:hypothetical protein